MDARVVNLADRWRLNTYWSVDAKLLTILGLSVGTFLIYEWLLFLAANELSFPLAFVFCAGASLFLLPVLTSSLTRAVRIVYFALLVSMAAYLFLGHPYPFASPVDQEWLYVALLAMGFLGLFFTAAGFCLLSLVVVVKRQGAEALGIAVTSTDFLTVIEFGLMIILVAGIVRYWSRSTGWLAIQSNQVGAYNDQLLLVLIGVHFGNYFWSGMQKLVLNGGPLSWVIHNPTWALSDFATLSGHHPLLHWPIVVEWITWLMWQNNIAFNLFVLLTQLICIVALLRRRWTIWITAVYDVQHIGIFMTTGIFFWKWIILNTALVAALKAMRFAFTKTAIGAAIIMVLIGPWFFSISRLGWYDTKSANLVELRAITRGDQSAVVPSNHFLFASVWVAQMDSMAGLSGKFQTKTWGATADFAIASAANRCELDSPYQGTTDRGRKRLETLTRQHYALYLARDLSRTDFDLYPHHIWSTPFYFTEARNLHWQAVEAYEWTLRRVCFDRDRNGRKIVTNEVGDVFRVEVSR